jgi:hypothetical protein
MRYTRLGWTAPRSWPVFRSQAGIPIAVVPVLVAAAILGYVAGHSGANSESGAERARTAKAMNVLVEYPRGWRPVSGSSPIPGLSLKGERLLAPRGDASTAGLLVGQLASDGAAPLPVALLERVRSQPQTAVVELAEVQAYRYARLRVRGFEHTLTVFVVPGAGGRSTALACYAASDTSPNMRACEEAAASATIAVQPPTLSLNPERSYASAISTAIGRLDRLRVALKGDLRPQASAATAERLARQLAGGYAAAGATLSTLEPSAASQRAQVALSEAIGRARAGYAALAAAAGERSASAYADAQRRIATAEGAVDRALENFVLLGYSAR